MEEWENLEIAPGIESIPAAVPFYSGPYPPNVYLLTAGGEAALIDSGFGDEESLRIRQDYLSERLNLRIPYIILTHHHLDHAGGAHRLRKATEARVAMHRDEVRFLDQLAQGAPQDVGALERHPQLWQAASEARPDILLSDGQTLAVNGQELEVVHTPGHTLGSICLYERKARILFTGDTILGVGTVAISPPPYGDMALYLRSLERLKGYDIAMMLPGHGPPVEEPQRKIQELIDHRHEREEQIIQLIAAGKAGLTQLLAEIYPELDRRIMPMARRQVLAHLSKLRDEGRVALTGEGDALRASFP